MACGKAPSNLDCDGIPDNGCESKSTTNDNCGACGVKCVDPAKPCINTAEGFRCGCPDGKILCPLPDGSPMCVDPSRDDANCGGCGNTCDPAGDGSALPPHTYYGCRDGKCGKRKCEISFPSNYMDCDGDIDLPSSNGCESSNSSPDSCGACGNACGPDQQCQGNEVGTFFCACPEGETYCGDICLDIDGHSFCLTGKCTDIASDRENCGACKHACPQSLATTPLTVATCTFGTCGTECVQGRADCNGNPADECEVDTNSDPRNCGGCGVVCDAVAGQACVGGRCVVEPCTLPQDDGGIK